MPRAAAGSPLRSRRRGHLAGLDEPQPRRCRRGRRKSRRKHSPSRSLRRTISCCRLCHLFSRTNSSSTACTSAEQSAAPPRPRLGQRAVAVAAADDVADAVFMAVDGELVAGGQARHWPRISASCVSSKTTPARPAGARTRRPGRPAQAVAVVEGVVADRRSCPRVRRRLRSVAAASGPARGLRRLGGWVP